MLLAGLGGVGKGGALFGDGVVPSWVNKKLAPGSTDQREALGFAQTARDVITFKYFFYGPNLVWFAMACATHAFFPYDIEGLKGTSAVSSTAAAWIGTRFVFNFTTAFAYYSFFYYGLYIAGWGARKFKQDHIPPPATWRTISGIGVSVLCSGRSGNM